MLVAVGNSAPEDLPFKASLNGSNSNKDYLYLDPQVCRILAFYRCWTIILPTLGWA